MVQQQIKLLIVASPFRRFVGAVSSVTKMGSICFSSVWVGFLYPLVYKEIGNLI